MLVIRNWSVRNARALERAYQVFEKLLITSEPLLRRIGHARLEKPVAAAESVVKGVMFDCRMCGQCVLSSTGMSCPMNCPKSLRNGPCGGVRQDGMCEVTPHMKCVWVMAADGASRMRGGDSITTPRPPIDHRLNGRSSWLAVAGRSSASSPP